MSKLSLININKTYRKSIKAVKDFSFESRDHEFVVILGQSGCGKTTLLRLISGLDNPDSGEIFLDDELLNYIDASKRDVAMVFQNYALYPQMTAYQNLSIPLKTKKMRRQVFDKHGNPVLMPDIYKIEEIKTEIDNTKDKNLKKELKKQIKELKANPSLPTYEWRSYSSEEIDKKIQEVASYLDIIPFLYQQASTLSGGQKQRVALGKAMVREPKIFLMDEPLSNLDAKLRSQAMVEIKKVHNKGSAVTIFVTHDQNEAMSLADRIIIMKDGNIEQIGTPDQILDNPKNMFVAGFVGNPPMNMIETAKNKEGKLEIELDDNNIVVPLDRKFNEDNIVIGVRPNKVTYNPCKNSFKTPVICEYSELLGHDMYCYAFLGEQRIIVKLPNKKRIEPETRFDAYIDLDALFYFSKETGERI